MSKFSYPWIFCLILLCACQPAIPEAASPEIAQEPVAPIETQAQEELPLPTETETLETWQILGQPRAPLLTLQVGFVNPSDGIAVGDDGVLHYTRDGGQSWARAENQSMGLYGLDMLDEAFAIGCGTGSSIRVTLDGGQTWQVGTNFGSSVPGHCRFLSFVDAQTGWGATPAILGTTTDGGQSWTNASLPEAASSIAAIALVTPGQGYLLDISGTLYATTDNGLTWSQAGTLPLGEITIAAKNYPQAAMRFQDPSRGMLVISALLNGTGLVRAFHTADGGQSWTSEDLPAPYGVPYLSRDGRFLTLLMLPSSLTLLQYHGQ